MIIALDATPLAGPPGGIPRYTASLVEALTGQFPEDQYWLLADRAFSPPAAANLQTLVSSSRRWWSFSLPRQLRRLGIQVFHGTDFAVPYLPVRASVMTVHDLSPWLYPQWQHSAKRVKQRTPMLLKAGLANMVITPSETIRGQSIRHFKLPSSQVVAIPLAAAACFRPTSCAPPMNPYFLYVGTIEPRKNVTQLIEAWRYVRSYKKIDLILAGRLRDDGGKLEQEPGLQHCEGATDEKLAQLYTGATAVVYPSSYEGFGLPVLEAMQCGALVVTSRDPAIGEITGSSASSVTAVRIDPHDAHALAEALLAVARQPDSFREIRQRAVKRAGNFTWAKTAKQTREVYEQAARLFSHS